jgi:hypothetical protein
MIDSWNNDELTFGEKFVSTLSGIAMAVPGVIGAVKGLSPAIAGVLN